MKKILTQLDEIENLKSFSTKSKPSVSDASVGWHLEHSLLVIKSILEGLQKSDPQKYQSQNKLSKFLVLLTGYIPRKGGKAPKFTIPNNEAYEENVTKYLETVKNSLSQVNEMAPNSFIQHPYFGHLNRNTSIKFLYIHTNHHLKIVRGILK